jgi:hypothetical protein
MSIELARATVDVGMLAQEFALSEQDLLIRSLQAFITEQLRLFRAEKQARCAKFGVVSLEEMDKLIVEGKVTEEEILDDFQNVDYLTARIERLEQFLETLYGQSTPLGSDRY